MGRKRWEYIWRQTSADKSYGESELNKLGEEGWELCGVIPWLDGLFLYYFKREVVKEG